MRYDGRGGRSQDRSESRVTTSALADAALLAVPVVLVVAASYPALAAGVVVGAVSTYAVGRIHAARTGGSDGTEGQAEGAPEGASTTAVVPVTAD